MFRVHGRITLAGLAAGAINGLFGAGGGMLLVPLLGNSPEISDEEIFPCSISVILPVSIVSAVVSGLSGRLSLADALPFLPGSALGGLAAGLWGRKIPTVWLHRGLGILIVAGGIRYLC